VPLFEYICRQCGHTFEALVRDAIAPCCPSCGSDTLQKILSSFAVNSEGTRRSALDAGRKHQAKKQRDKTIADKEESDHHHH
jgi:putative FmdB family regulatory protein